MKFVNKTINYSVLNSEECGIITEEILCNFYNIEFKTTRKHNYEIPKELKEDIFNSGVILKNINIIEHVGNKNIYYDFKTSEEKTVSLKTFVHIILDKCL